MGGTGGGRWRLNDFYFHHVSLSIKLVFCSSISYFPFELNRWHAISLSCFFKDHWVILETEITRRSVCLVVSSILGMSTWYFRAPRWSCEPANIVLALSPSGSWTRIARARMFNFVSTKEGSHKWVLKHVQCQFRDIHLSSSLVNHSYVLPRSEILVLDLSRYGCI